MKSSEIPSLLNPETYHVINPGKTKDNCSPGPFVVCCVIIVTSPDEWHWGGSGFMKDDQTGLGGDIRHFPAWSLPQLQAASTQLSKVQFQDDHVPELCSIFGGIPRQVFAPNRKERNCTDLKRKVESMAEQKLCNIVMGQINQHLDFGIDQPGGGIVEVWPKENFKEVELMLASSSTLKWVQNRFMSSIWTAMATHPSPTSWQLLEDCPLYALQKSNQCTARACVRKSDAAHNQPQNLLLGQCNGTALKSDCTTAVIDGPNLIAFHSSERNIRSVASSAGLEQSTMRSRLLRASHIWQSNIKSMIWSANFKLDLVEEN